jgi:integrase
MMAAGVPVKAISTFAGHSSVAITFDRYWHLFTGSADEATGLINAFLRCDPATVAIPSAA